MYRMFAMDLDGTLLMSDGSIPDETVDVLKRISAEGVHLVLATGRMTRTCEIYSKMLGGALIASFNAAVIKMPDGRIIRNELPSDIIRKVAVFCKERNIYLQTYDGDRICVKEACQEFEKDLDTQINEYIEYGELSEADLGPTPKIVIVDYDDKKISAVRKELELMLPELTITQSSKWVLEILPKGVDKAYGLKVLSEELGIDPKDIVAIGDNHNDIPMVKYAGMGVAVGNADDALKSVADMTVTRYNSYGVKEAVLKLFPEFF